MSPALSLRDLQSCWKPAGRGRIGERWEKEKRLPLSLGPGRWEVSTTSTRLYPRSRQSPHRPTSRSCFCQRGFARGHTAVTPISRRAAKPPPVPSSNRILTREHTDEKEKKSGVFWSKSCQLQFLRRWEQTAHDWK